MPINIESALSKPTNAAKFASAFIKAYTFPAFGTRSKSEIDLLVFGCLIDAGAIDPKVSEYEIARALNITPTRVRTLVLNWQLRSTPPQTDMRGDIVEALKKTRYSGDGKSLTFGVESPLLREEIVARLKLKGVFPDASFSKELVKLPVDAFADFLDDVLDADTKKQVRTTLVKDKQLPDLSFKALATGILAKLGEKALGEASDTVAKKLVDSTSAQKAVGFVVGLLRGDAKGASRAITKDDYAAG
jgi:hypothetical protein